MSQRRHTLFPVGFHGDRYLLEVVDAYLSRASHFVETGTNVGSTLRYVASRYPQVQCRSCEPDLGAFNAAQDNLRGFPRAVIDNTDSISFMQGIADWLPEHGTGLVCWLDAHGHGFRWPLREEVEFFSGRYPEAAIFIDDFKVPARPDFGFDQYDGQECSFEYICDSIVGDNREIAYPNYREHTSTHHPLRGWCLIRPRGQTSPNAERRHATAFTCSELRCA